MATANGKITQIIGAVVDVQFAESSEVAGGGVDVRGAHEVARVVEAGGGRRHPRRMEEPIAQKGFDCRSTLVGCGTS